ncbi:F-box/LRR-repeat protein 8-like [Babylonia areolata]|uniref:F-box/LRR-repeat protein 8-like n=1 Tax=Babylonia areolata TaxID=304850 RepID=UPI003FCFF234
MAADEESRNEDGGMWAALPDHILVMVLSYLTPHQRLQMALTCRSWSTCLKHPLFWRRFLCHFKSPGHEKVLSAVEHHGHRIRAFVMEIDQSSPDNRKNACKALNRLAKTTGRKLTSLEIHFVGQNPYFYAGQEFVVELKLLFGCIEDNPEPFSLLTHIDLSGLDIALDDSLFDILAENHPHLEFLNIQNKSLVCKVSSRCMQRLVSRCRKLKDLRVFHLSLTDDILTDIAEQNEPCLQRLSIIYRRETKYTSDLSSEAWSRLVTRIPSLRVTLGFDHTCPLHRISEVMKPEIPVTELRLETFTRIYEEVNLATSFYKETLEKLVLQTRNSEELGQALLRLAEKCEQLNALLVYCVLSQDVIDRILDLRPLMRQRGSFILKSTLEEGPWVVGAETNEEAEEQLIEHR